MCSGGLVVLVKAAVWLKLGVSLSKVEEVVGEFLHRGDVCLRMAETKSAEGRWRADIQCPTNTTSWKTDSEGSQIRRHERLLQQTSPAGNILPTIAAMLSTVSSPPATMAANRRRHVTAAVMLNGTVAVGIAGAGRGFG